VPPGYFFPAHPVTETRVKHTLTARNWVLVVVVTAVLAALVGGGVGYVAASHSQQTIVEKFFPNSASFPKLADIQAILAKVEPAVVSIDTTAVTRGGDGTVEGAGTGMILTSGGEVLTNNHVVAAATSVTVTLFGQTDPRPAHVIGTDPSQDLALVQIENVQGLPTVQLGDSAQARVGDSVLAIGNALALAGGLTVTEGIVSSKNRSLTATSDITGRSENLSGLLQTDAAINSGNSGGPLVNSSGQVIGMNTAVAESTQGNAPAQDIGFAIAIDTIKPLLAGLRSGGTGGA
jgi:putative serine protease PepD